METYFLYAFCALSLLGGIGMVISRNAIHCAIALLGSMMCLAAVYALLGAHLLAALQIIIYAGAIIILIVYVIMLLRPDGEDAIQAFRKPGLMAAPLALLFLVLFGKALLPLADVSPEGDVLTAADVAVPGEGSCTDMQPEKDQDGVPIAELEGAVFAGQVLTDCADPDCAQSKACYGTVKAVGAQLLGRYILPFELSSVLLLAGIVGAVLLSGRKPDELAAEPPPASADPVDPDQPRPGGEVQS